MNFRVPSLRLAPHRYPTWRDHPRDAWREEFSPGASGHALRGPFPRIHDGRLRTTRFARQRAWLSGSLGEPG